MNSAFIHAVVNADPQVGMGDWLPEQNLPVLRQEEQAFWLEAILPGMMVHALKKKTGTGYHLASTGYHLFTPTPLTVHDGDS